MGDNGLQTDDGRPLADRLRPRALADFAGQAHLGGEGAPLARLAASGRMHSMILWGPPGSGKTTLARLLADHAGLGYGEGYRYAHDEAEAYAAGERYFPAELDPQRYYQPADRGLEAKIKARLERLEALDERTEPAR